MVRDGLELICTLSIGKLLLKGSQYSVAEHMFCFFNKMILL